MFSEWMNLKKKFDSEKHSCKAILFRAYKNNV